MKLGKTGIDVSRIGLGTWAIGGGPAFQDSDDKSKSIATIQQALNYGINFIDTAPAYNFGNSETIVGEALKNNREKYTIITKCGITWERKGAFFNKVGDRSLYKNLTPKSIELELKESLKRLQTDYIDIYMTHWQAVEPYYTPISETMAYLTSLKEQGKIRGIGAANVTAADVREYLKHGDLDIVQAKYSILDREIETELLPLCKENNITLQAYSPLAMGILSGTISKDYVPPKGSARNGKKWFKPDNLAKVVAMLDKWKPLCDKYDCSMANLAIAWILAQGTNVNVLSGSTTPEELAENSKAKDINIDLDDVKYMRKLAEELD
ncbi:aldo/keto reductase [Loigolactobacillus coryniformis]|uniref:Aldo/keto reductase n=1 Tax=Loigolactobacillus coryniformis TaxID=1610 RepID=A0A5B8TFI6_9LACO|nr:aldo/keto reductase [Loigolactobacillus coryniformis]QEA52585.1 aldo/keto reductase [Loigolactobacillus coryniformis]